MSACGSRPRLLGSDSCVKFSPKGSPRGCDGQKKRETFSFPFLCFKFFWYAVSPSVGSGVVLYGFFGLVGLGILALVQRSFLRWRCSPLVGGCRMVTMLVGVDVDFLGFVEHRLILAKVRHESSPGCVRVGFTRFGPQRHKCTPMLVRLVLSVLEMLRFRYPHLLLPSSGPFFF